jgi:hypothetical protein
VTPHPTIPLPDILAASKREDVVAAMREFYTAADMLVASKGATCWNSGECCRFGKYGHRLYITTLELCYYVAAGRGAPPITEDSCPHAYAGRCHARDQRPAGCRIYFCDPTAEAWQGPITELLLGRLKQMHEELAVPYVYADWMQALHALEAAGFVDHGRAEPPTVQPDGIALPIIEGDPHAA